jgi:hypothetical protein
MMPLGLVLELSIAVTVAALIELFGGARRWIPPVGRAAGIVVAYLAAVLLLAPSVRAARLPIVEPMAGMPAAAAGVEKGDVIRKVNGVGVDAFEDLSGAMGSASEVTLVLERGGATRELKVTRTAEGVLGVKPIGAERPRSAGDFLIRPLYAMRETVRAIARILNPEPLTVGGPLKMTVLEHPVSFADGFLARAGIAASFCFPLVAAAMLVSLFLRPRLLNR